VLEEASPYLTRLLDSNAFHAFSCDKKHDVDLIPSPQASEHHQIHERLYRASQNNDANDSVYRS
jgi:hypothetical protein